eukprot:gb/GECG01005387.1/.p1 GENE.gb/GECG01005387.1/~~gb/GECG01005387.1/.p1  ORF type:complete len:263 (+),score=11.32 gb/GECG01005387.1/:1-789(+)
MEDLVERILSPREVVNHGKVFPGPTDTSNWIIPGILLVGAYPGSAFGPERHRKTIEGVVKDAGVTTFVCLQPRDELEHRFIPYMHIAAELSTEANRQHQWSERNLPPRKEIYDASRLYQTESEMGPRAKYHHFSSASYGGPYTLERHGLTQLVFQIQDTRTAEDNDVLGFIQHLVERINVAFERRRKGDYHERFYIHCWGGHGRTGTITSLLLIALYGVTAETAIAYVMYSLSYRRWTKCSLCRPQKAQVRRLAPELIEGTE